MFTIKNITTICLGLVLISCGGKTTDPSTVDRDDLNPPVKLASLTGDSQVELRWFTANAEEDLQGYDVFAVDFSKVKSTLPKFPSGVTLENLNSKSIPRCEDNNDFFSLFGLPKTDSSCDADATEEKKESSLSSFSGKSNLLEEESEETTKKLAGIVKCDGQSSTDISLEVKAPSLSTQSCVVKEIDGKKLENGTTYMFFVVAVMGDDKDKISWTSNFITDTPRNEVFSGEIELSSNKMKSLDVSKIITKAVVADFVEETCEDSVCKVLRENTKTDDRIWLGRRGENDFFPHRVVVSTRKSGKIWLKARGAKTRIGTSATIFATTLGDEADVFDEASYSNSGLTSPVYGNQVFDMAILDSNGKPNYGKIIFHSRAIADIKVKTSLVKVKMTILYQPTLDLPSYFY